MSTSTPPSAAPARVPAAGAPAEGFWEGWHGGGFGSEADFLTLLAWFMASLAVVVFAASLRTVSPYGRYTAKEGQATAKPEEATVASPRAGLTANTSIAEQGDKGEPLLAAEPSRQRVGTITLSVNRLPDEEELNRPLAPDSVGGAADSPTQVDLEVARVHTGEEEPPAPDPTEAPPAEAGAGKAYAQMEEGGSKPAKPAGGEEKQLWSSTAVPAKVAWVVQECPAFFVSIICMASGNAENKASAANRFLGAFFVWHYLVRSFIYPMLIRGGKPVPLSTMIMALLFCAWNGYLQGRSLAVGTARPDDYLADARFVIGTMMFVGGFVMNQHSDHVLRNLRKPGEKGYKIPYGGAFRFISAPNLVGECVEWGGFCVACWQPHALAFSLFVCANLLPRALQHHKWYKVKFGDAYPPNRRAWIPFVF